MKRAFPLLKVVLGVLVALALFWFLQPWLNVWQRSPFTIQFDELQFVGVAPSELTDLKFFPGTLEFLATQRNGLILHGRVEQKVVKVLGSFWVSGTHVGWDSGLMSLVIDPQFRLNHYFYVGQSVSKTRSIVGRLTFDPANYEVIASSQRDIITIEEPRAKTAMHNVGSIGFEDNNVMWIFVGERTYPDNAQNPSNNMGALLRIVPERHPDKGGYSVATGNQPVSKEALPEVFAFGMRMPWRATVDSLGRYWFGDVGQRYEEINVVTHWGQNFGWGKVEGSIKEHRKSGYVGPVLLWGKKLDQQVIRDDPHLSALAIERNKTLDHRLNRVAWVGSAYREEERDRYDGHLFDGVLVGEMCLGWIRFLRLDRNNKLIENRHVGHRPFLSGMDQASDGFLYAVSFGGCTVHKIGEAKMYRLVLGPSK